MEINATVTKEQILNLITNWDYADIFDFIRDIDDAIFDWEFTILLWLYLDNAIKSGFEYDEITDSTIELVKEQYKKRLS